MLAHNLDISTVYSLTSVGGGSQGCFKSIIFDDISEYMKENVIGDVVQSAKLKLKLFPKEMAVPAPR